MPSVCAGGLHDNTEYSANLTCSYQVTTFNDLLAKTMHDTAQADACRHQGGMKRGSPHRLQSTHLVTLFTRKHRAYRHQADNQTGSQPYATRCDVLPLR